MHAGSNHHTCHKGVAVGYNVVGKHILGNARVFDNARVSGDAGVFDNAQVSGDAQVSGNAWVSGSALVSGNARVSGSARVYGIMRSDGYCFIYVPCADDKWRVIAGCRYFTMDEARSHWGSPDYRDAKLATETLVILDCLEKLRAVKSEGV